MKTYDVIIVGAGPAGLIAARQLHKANINYLLIELSSKIGQPLRCGEGIREKEFKEFFGRTDFKFVKNTVRYHEIKYAGLERKIRANFLQLDKPEFEKWLAKDLNIKLGTACIDVKINKDYAEIITSKEIYKTKLAILCNGPHFVIQTNLGLNKKEKQLFVGYGGIYECKNLNKDSFQYIFDKDYAGYLWIFPKTDKIANIGFGAWQGYNDFKPNQTKKVLHELLKKHKINAKQKSEYGGVVPYMGPIDKTYTDRLMVCGNAAGQVHAGTGEGIYYALKAGVIAGKVAIDAVKNQDCSADFLKKYETEWKKAFDKQMEAGLMFAEALAFAYKYDIVEKVFNQPSEKELKQMVLLGKMPIRAKIASRIIRRYDLLNKNARIPITLKLMYKAYNIII